MPLIMPHWCNGYYHREMDLATQVQILDEAVCISHSANTLGKVYLQLGVNRRTERAL